MSVRCGRRTTPIRYTHLSVGSSKYSPLLHRVVLRNSCADQYGDKEKIQALYSRYLKAFNAKDVNTIMAMYDPKELFVFDVVPPQESTSWTAYKKDWEGLFAAYPGPLKNQMSEQAITVVGSLAYSHCIQSGYFTGKDAPGSTWRSA